MWLALGALSGFLAVALGAFGAHALKDRLTPDLLTIYQTGAHYHLAHALALSLVGIARRTKPATALSVAGWAFLIGTVIFAGSLYALAITGIRQFGAITPIGGVAFMIGWIALAIDGFSRRSTQPEQPHA
ncbi:MAG: DUF423 domain-containing protein [Phycisphaerae bacterium]